MDPIREIGLIFVAVGLIVTFVTLCNYSPLWSSYMGVAFATMGGLAVAL